MRRVFFTLACVSALALSGCGGYRATPEMRQEMANSQATIIEAAEAIKLGADIPTCLQAIRANAEATITALGYAAYVPTTEQGDAQ